MFKGILLNKKGIRLPVEIWKNNSEVLFGSTHLFIAWENILVWYKGST